MTQVPKQQLESTLSSIGCLVSHFVYITIVEFDPRMLDPKIVDRVKREDLNFFDDLDNRNTHIIGFKQNNWMFISRKIKRKMKSTFANSLGIPPIYHNQPFIRTLYGRLTNYIKTIEK